LARAGAYTLGRRQRLAHRRRAELVAGQNPNARREREAVAINDAIELGEQRGGLRVIRSRFMTKKMGVLTFSAESARAPRSGHSKPAALSFGRGSGCDPTCKGRRMRTTSSSVVGMPAQIASGVQSERWYPRSASVQGWIADLRESRGKRRDCADSGPSHPRPGTGKFDPNRPFAPGFCTK